MFGLVFVVSGIAFKLGVVPYHMWVPDVYDGAPTAITLLIGTAPKLAAFAMTLRLLAGALQGLRVRLAGHADRAVRAVDGARQPDRDRADEHQADARLFDDREHGLHAAWASWPANRNGYSAAMFYTVAYVLTSLASFGMSCCCRARASRADQLDDFKGLNQRSPWWAFIMLLVMFSLAGMPPTIGFYAKFMVIEAAVNDGFVWLAVVAVLTSLIGAFYYLRIVKLMYFDDPVETLPIVARGDTRVAAVGERPALLVLGILPQQLIGLCAIALTQSNFP